LADVPDWEAGGEDSSEGLEPSYHASSSALSTPAASPPPEASGRRDVGDGLPGLSLVASRVARVFIATSFLLWLFITHKLDDDAVVLIY